MMSQRMVLYPQCFLPLVLLGKCSKCFLFYCENLMYIFHIFFYYIKTSACLGPSIGGFLLEKLNYRPSTIFIFIIDILMVSKCLMDQKESEREREREG